MFVLFPLVALLILALVPVPAFAVAPLPAYGTGVVVDGSYSTDWNLTDDFFADMYRAGKSDKALESKSYLKYDCNTGTMYVLVLTESGINALAEGWEDAAFAKITEHTGVEFNGNTNNDGTPPDFSWVGLSGDGVSAQGYEASFKIAEGTYKVQIHIQVYDDDENQTSSTEGQHDGIDLNIECPGGPVPELPAGVLFALGITGICGFVWFNRRQKTAVK
jgi:hypothetical protein